MLPSIYDYSDYKIYVKDSLRTFPSEGRGMRKNLAYALKCQLPFVSHVLNGHYHFSPEQGFDLARFFELSDDECDYLIRLIALNRSSNSDFSLFLTKQLARARSKNDEVKGAVKIKSELSSGHQATYYSHWAYPAAHMLLTLPGYSRRDSVAKRLRISTSQANKVINFLIEVGLVSQNKGSLKTDRALLFLSKDSPLLAQYHRNLRSLAGEVCFDDAGDDLHYSSMVTCSKSDFVKIRKILEKSLKEIVERIKDSKEEELAVFNIDWFTFKNV